MQALSDLCFDVGRQTLDQEASISFGRTDLDEQIFHIARCDGSGVSLFHGPQLSEHNFAKLLTIAQSWLGAVERLPMHSGDTDGPHINKWVSYSLAKLGQKHEHQSEIMMGVNGGSLVSSGPVALPHEKLTVEDKRTPVTPKVHHSFTYHTLQSIHRRPTVIGNSLYPVRLPPQLRKCGAHFSIPAIVLSMTLICGYDRTVFPTPKQQKGKYRNIE